MNTTVSASQKNKLPKEKPIVETNTNESNKNVSSFVSSPFTPTTTKSLHFDYVKSKQGGKVYQLRIPTRRLSETAASICNKNRSKNESICKTNKMSEKNEKRDQPIDQDLIDVKLVQNIKEKDGENQFENDVFSPFLKKGFNPNRRQTIATTTGEDLKNQKSTNDSDQHTTSDENPTLLSSTMYNKDETISLKKTKARKLLFHTHVRQDSLTQNYFLFVEAKAPSSEQDSPLLTTVAKIPKECDEKNVKIKSKNNEVCIELQLRK